MTDREQHIRRSVAMKAAATLAASIEPHSLEEAVGNFQVVYAALCQELGVDEFGDVVEAALGFRPGVSA